ncbi:signal transduction histidine kinase [Paenibacillus cellulosilyticus]|uniref:histidine kinase n=1 Tax=Paenibacillus cellulosilyticus TaxID=375489 RepID=A0A2V2YSW5_9BACL|nr:HAMP domain-containing sensor histidine kinase [Paenibacillus cellulosilyticus]PWW01249.1 signal transduction histidine kinase [Paenibacillus cellulosilyticus]QKS46800.1 HAMP domain-containing histidine kinase [Paenibacillus cellulosilyticus]
MILKTKLWLLLVVSAALSMVLFGCSSVWIGKIANKGYALLELNPLAHSIVDSIDEQPELGKDTLKSILDGAHEEHPSIRFLWMDSNGQAIYDTTGLNPNFTFRDLALLMQNMPEGYLKNDEVNILTPVSREGETYFMLLSLPASAMKQGEMYFLIRSHKSLLTLVAPLILSFSIPFLLGLWIFSRINKRIRKLNNAVNQLNLQSNSPVAELADSSKDELGQLARHYNSMAQRIHSQFGEIQQFENKRKLLLSNLSHDLRTPLTTMLGCAELIRTGNYKDQQELHTRAKIILQRCRYMDKLLDQMLEVSRQDEEDITIHLQNHNLSEIIRKIAVEYIMILDGEQVELDVEMPDEDVQLLIDASLIERALRNLLDNAVRYGKDGHYLGIELTADDQAVNIIVKDKGKGIPPAHQKHIFERFYRVDGGRKGEGLGIGLSIVKDISLAHRGTLEMNSRPFVETRFQIRLPVSTPV